MICRLIMTGLVWIAGTGLCVSDTDIRPEEQLHPEFRELRKKGDILEEMSRRPLIASQRDEYNEIARQARRLLTDYYQTHSGQDHYNGWGTWAIHLWRIYIFSFSPSCCTVFEAEELYWESVDLLENVKFGKDVREDVLITGHLISALDGFVSRWYQSHPEICARLIDEAYEKIHAYSLNVNQRMNQYKNYKDILANAIYVKAEIPKKWYYHESIWELWHIQYAAVLPPDRQKAFINERIPLFMSAVASLPNGVERRMGFWAKAMRQWYPSGDYGDIFVEAWRCWRDQQWDKSQSLFRELTRLYPETAGYPAIKKYLADCEAGIRTAQAGPRSQAI